MTQTIVPPAPPDEPLDTPRPADDTLTTATRYLCAGAYLDETFRDRALREVYHQPKRYVAPSHGFDLVMVLQTCLRARNLAIARDLTIVLTLGVSAYLNWLSFAVVGAALVCLRVTGAAWQLGRDFLARVRSGTAVDTTKSPRQGLLLLLGWAATLIVLVVLAGKTVSVLTAAGAGVRTVGTGGALLLALTVFVLPGVFALLRQKRVEQFTADGHPPPVRWTRRMREIDDQQDRNTVVYSNFEPFIGSGEVMSSWSFAQRLIRKEKDDPSPRRKPVTEGDREFADPPFTAAEIVSYVREHLLALTAEQPPELTIPNMTVKDRVFQSAREDGERTLTTTAERMRDIIRNPTNPQRHYLACRGISWGGDLITTVYVHLAVQGKSLYLECTSTSLAPCNDGYRIVDVDGGTGPRAWLRVLLTAVRETPATILRAPARLLRNVADLAGQGNGRTAPRGRRKDYGARVSVREMGTRDKLRNFTQYQDIVKFRRLIESRVYAHVLDFLDEHDVDTTEVRAQRAKYLSIGMYVDGDVNAKGDVIGQSTTINQQQPEN